MSRAKPLQDGLIAHSDELKKLFQEGYSCREISVLAKDLWQLTVSYETVRTVLKQLGLGQELNKRCTRRDRKQKHVR